MATLRNFTVQAVFAANAAKVYSETHDSLPAALQTYNVLATAPGVQGAALFDNDGDTVATTGEGPALVYVPVTAASGERTNPAPTKDK